MRTASLAVALLALTLAAANFASVDVKLSDVHICCGACVKGIQSAVAKVDGAKATIDKDFGTVEITAPDAATAQKVVDAIAAAGFHGASNSPQVKITDDSGATADKVKKIYVLGAHNCCRGCSNAIRDAIKTAPGVSDASLADIGARKGAIVLEGDFSPAEVVKALSEAGFHVKVSTTAP